jgi:hypothetical protein
MRNYFNQQFPQKDKHDDLFIVQDNVVNFRNITLDGGWRLFNPKQETKDGVRRVWKKCLGAVTCQTEIHKNGTPCPFFFFKKKKVRPKPRMDLIKERKCTRVFKS